MSANTTGYSGTPLARKLGLRAGMVVTLSDAPKGYQDLLAPLPAVRFAKTAGDATDLVHTFVTARVDLAKELRRLRKALRSDATIWVSWPKKSAGVPTDVTEDVVRAVALPLGFVDVKVCAVDQTWSALKLVVRKELR